MSVVGRVIGNWIKSARLMTDNYGFLAIWCDIASEDLNDYRDWLTKEHIADRTFSPGFLGVRLFDALDDERSHFILYATESPAVLSASAYKAILDNPSPWTQAIMPKFGNFDRAIGGQRLKIGNGYGAFIAVWRLQVDLSDLDWGLVDEHLGRVLDMAGAVSVRVFEVDDGVTDRPSVEKTMRTGKEGAFDLLVVAELDQAVGDGLGVPGIGVLHGVVGKRCHAHAQRESAHNAQQFDSSHHGSSRGTP